MWKCIILSVCQRPATAMVRKATNEAMLVTSAIYVHPQSWQGISCKHCRRMSTTNASHVSCPACGMRPSTAEESMPAAAWYWLEPGEWQNRPLRQCLRPNGRALDHIGKQLNILCFPFGLPGAPAIRSPHASHNRVKP